MSRTTVDHRRSALADFDESGWPVNALLLVLAACAAGAIAERGDFETLDLWANAWTHLAVLAGIVATIALTATLLRGHVQRRMQLAILASLAVHAAFSLSMRHYQLPVVDTIVDQPSELQEFKPTVVPDYQSLDTFDQTPIELFERPVETDTPDPERLLLEKPETPEPEVEAPKRQDLKNEQHEPKPVELQRAEPSPPKRAERLADPARSQTRPAEQPVESLKLPQATAETRTHNAPNPESTAQRTKTEVPESQPAARDVPLDVAPADTANLTRTQQSERVTPAELATPQMTRRADNDVRIARAAESGTGPATTAEGRPKPRRSGTLVRSDTSGRRPIDSSRRDARVRLHRRRRTVGR